jgi:hypothetical protein
MDNDIPAPSRLTLLLSRKLPLLIILGLALIYVAGIVVRMRSGIRVVVENHSRGIVRNVILGFEKRQSYSLGEIAPGKKKQVFLHSPAESSILMVFADANGTQHSAFVAGYTENDYCGDVAVRVLSDFSVRSRDESFALVNWKSWYGFL